MGLPVVLYPANVIDYARAVLLWYAYQAFVGGDQLGFVKLYLASYGLDALDGPVARALNQTSKLGVYLDMIMDRVSSCLALHLAAVQIRKDFPSQTGEYLAFGLYGVMILVEIVAHSVVMVKSELGGVHQKEMPSPYKIVQLYLTNKPILFSSCVAFEAATLSIIMNNQTLLMVFLPGFLFRSVANILRLVDIMAPRAPGQTGKQE
mmetsp:Transcript_16092/g.28578  ORF Transcript_16092/g.28578 Transcript_16092/m.28578 type:complete len:206 (-) Transcript_16092:638-1255(-)